MSFASLPPVPTSGLSQAEFQLLSAISQNIGQLIGQGSTEFRAVIAGQVTVSLAPEGSATGATVTGTVSDVVGLAASLQALINDVQVLRSTLNTLIAQLRS